MGFIVGVSLFSLTLFTLNYFTTVIFFRFTCECPMSSIRFFQILGQDIINTAHALTTGGLVLGIRVAKEWVSSQKENQNLIRLKISNELHLQKARIYPGFLFQSLNALHFKMISGSADSPTIILTLSDLLSYLLYDSTEEWIPLEKELGMIVNLLSIERINRRRHLTIHSKIMSTSNNKFIKPLTLFPLLQNCFEALGSSEKEYYAFYLDIKEVSQMLHVLLIVERVSEKSNLTEWDQMLNNFKARIMPLPNEEYRLKIENRKDRSLINLQLLLANDR
jgi:two-component system LytT family sensor kinase